MTELLFGLGLLAHLGAFPGEAAGSGELSPNPSDAGLVRGAPVALSVAGSRELPLEPILRPLVFRDTPLSEVTRTLQLHYGKQVMLADSELAGHTVTAWFGDSEFEDVVKVVCAVLGARCSITPHGARIGGAGSVYAAFPGIPTFSTTPAFAHEDPFPTARNGAETGFRIDEGRSARQLLDGGEMG